MYSKLTQLTIGVMTSLADTAGAVGVAPVFKRSRSKPEIYKTIDGRVIVEDELLNFLAVKIKTLSQDEIVLLATNTFDSAAIEASKKVLFELCPATTQRCIGHKGQCKDMNNIKLCLKVLNECGENIPRFVSHYLDELPPVTFSSLDVSCLLRRMEQLCAEVGVLKHISKLQTIVCEEVRAGAEEINRRVTVLECRSDAPTRDASLCTLGLGAADRPARDNHLEEQGERGGTAPCVLVMHGAAGLGSRATPDLSTGVRRDEKVVTTVGLNVGSGATGKDPAGSSTGSPRWSKVVKDGRSRQNPRRNVAEGSGARAISI